MLFLKLLTHLFFKSPDTTLSNQEYLDLMGGEETSDVLPGNPFQKFPNEILTQIFLLLAPSDHKAFFYCVGQKGLQKDLKCKQEYYTIALREHFELDLETLKQYVISYLSLEEKIDTSSILLSPEALYAVQYFTRRYPLVLEKVPEIFKYVQRLPDGCCPFPELLKVAIYAHNLQLVKWLCEKKSGLTVELLSNLEGSLSGRRALLLKSRALLAELDGSLAELDDLLPDSRALLTELDNSLEELDDSLPAIGITYLPMLRYFIAQKILIPTQAALNRAADSGNLSMVQFLLAEPYNLRPDKKTLDRAAGSGNLSMVQLLLAEPYNLRPDKETLDRAAGSELLHALKVIQAVEWHSMPDISILKKIVWHFDRLSVVQFLLGKPYNLRPDKETLDSAASSGNLSIVQLLLGKPYNLRPDKETLGSAASSGNLSMVQLLLAEPYNLRPDEETLDIAICFGNLSVVQLLLEKASEASLDLEPAQTLNNIAYWGDLSLIQRLIEGPWNFVPDQETLDSAASSGNLLLVQRLIEGPWNLVPDQETLDSAASSGNLLLVQRLIEGPWNLVPDQETLDSAASSSNLLLVQRLIEGPWKLVPTQETFLSATKHAQLNISQYLYVNYPKITHGLNIEPYTPAQVLEGDNVSCNIIR